jgi:hypothetical protein
VAQDDSTPRTLDEILERVTAETLPELSAEDLAALRADLDGVIESMPSEARDWTDEHIAAGMLIEAAQVAITADENRRDAEAATREAAASDLLAKLKGTPDEGEPAEVPVAEAEAETPEPEVAPEADTADVPEAEAPPEIAAEVEIPEEEPVKVAASAKPVVRRVEARSATKPIPRPAAVDERLVLRASANAGAFGAGALLDSPDKIARVFLGAIQASAGYAGPTTSIPLMSLGAWDAADVYGEDRTLRDNARENAHKIEAVTGIEALRASGGICAPAPVRYDQPVIGTNARPVRDSAVAMFGADRGGIRTLPPPHLADVGGAITTWTHANDIALNSPSTKACLTLTCPDEDETLVDAIVSCLKVGNYRARNFPEQITAWMSKIAQSAARTAEVKFLTAIGTGSTQVAVTATGNELGTARDILATLERATSAIRSRHRLDPMYPFRFVAPFWLRNNMITDLTREVPGSSAERLATSEADIERWLAAKNVNVTWTLDGESGQIYGAQADGVLNGWASHVICYLYPEGQWLGLDGGSLDFGLVRDSTLNATNDFQLMSEFFENVHQVFLADSYRLDIDICPNGKTSLPVAIDPCTAGS